MFMLYLISFAYFFPQSYSDHPDLLFPYTTLFRSDDPPDIGRFAVDGGVTEQFGEVAGQNRHCSGGQRLQDGTAECRSEEHTSELQSRGHIVCCLLLEERHINRKISDVC